MIYTQILSSIENIFTQLITYFSMYSSTISIPLYTDRSILRICLFLCYLPYVIY
jgi:hypothetical protein